MIVLIRHNGRETEDRVWRIMSDEAGKPDLGRFFTEKYRKLVRYFQVNYSGLSDMEAEDIVSELMAELFERSEIMERVENVSAYIYQSIRNKANDYLRRRKKTVSLEETASEDAGRSTERKIPELRYDMTAELEAAEIRQRLAQALDALQPDLRAVWIATELEGWSFQELSEEWDVPVGTLLARKHRANAALQKALQDFKNR